MKASRYVRTGGALGHLLLVVVLALGVFVMHSVGHPDGASGPGTSAAAHASAMGTGHTSAMGADPAAMDPSAASAAKTRATGHDRSPSASHQPGHGMDMASLCVAVLGAWVLTALLCAALTRRPGRAAAVRAQVAALPRPDPPPRGPDLTCLSVLRI